MIISGILYLLHLFIPELTYDWIFRCWPSIFILLGIEILIANRKDHVSFVYDKGAIALLTLLTLFAMGMAGTDFILRYR
jgi:hypothetical protein